MSNVKFLYNEKEKRNSKLKIHCKIIDINLNSEERKIFKKTFSEISDTINVDNLMGWNTKEKDFTLGKNPKLDPTNSYMLINRKVCSEAFEGLAVNSNGGVSVCCVDWAHEIIVGNAFKKSLPEIWSGKLLKRFRIKQVSGLRSKIPMCKDCHYILGIHPKSNIDKYSNQILRKLKGKNLDVFA